MATNVIALPGGYYPDPAKGRPVFNGKIFIGEPDLDPTVEGNRKNVTIVEEDGTEVPILPAGQPLLTGAGGVIMFNGSPVFVQVEGTYSLTIQNSQDVTVYAYSEVPETGAGTAGAHFGWGNNYTTDDQQRPPANDPDNIELSGQWELPGPSNPNTPFTDGMAIIAQSINTVNNPQGAVQLAIREDGTKMSTRGFDDGVGWDPWFNILYECDYGIGCELSADPAPEVTTLDLFSGENGFSGLFSGEDATGQPGGGANSAFTLLQMAGNVVNQGVQAIYEINTANIDDGQPWHYVRVAEFGSWGIFRTVVTQGVYGVGTSTDAATAQKRTSFNDADDMTRQGWYGLAGSEANIPFSGTGWLEHNAHGHLATEDAIQSAVEHSNPGIEWCRRNIAGSWEPWVDMSSTSIGAIATFNVNTLSLIKDDNVATFDRNSEGNFTVTYTSALPSSSVSLINVEQDELISSAPCVEIESQTTTTCNFRTRGGAGGGVYDPDIIYFTTVSNGGS